jgi:predicted dehydrogenase
MTNTSTRREFLKHGTLLAGAVGAATIVPRHVLGGPRNIPPSEKMNIACVGVAGMGSQNLMNLQTENIVALCDVDPVHAAPVFKRYPKANVYADFRVMLDRQSDIDGLLVATPDHTHAVVSMAAIRAGKHVYCQKPLTHTVYEARMLAKAAKEAKITTQMGIQGHSGEGIRLICEWIWAGLIGEVREVDAWCSLSYYPWGHKSWSPAWPGRRPVEMPPVPAGLDWDLWIGPAPMRPYHRVYHPESWRAFWDFGNGMMGDRGAHSLDPIYWAMKLTPPESIEATSCGNTAEVHPLSAIVSFRFPAREGLPPLKLTWYEGTRPPRPDDLEDGRQLPDEGGVLFKGSKATILCGVYGQSPRIIPEAKMREAKLPAKTIPRIHGSHEQDWVRACKAGRQAGADFSYSGPLTEICLLGNIATRVDGRIVWDAENLKITNLPAANQYVHKEYRKGWTL